MGLGHGGTVTADRVKQGSHGRKSFRFVSIMSDRTRNKKIAPKSEVNEYKKKELVAAAKETGLKVVDLPNEMIGKG